MEEFWFDAVIMYNALLDVGYTDDNIFLLFGRGYDYEPSSYPIALEYDPDPNITDYPARVVDVENIFEWLRDGNPSQGIPALTDDDFLFVWTFDHGGFEDLNGNWHWDEGEEVFLCLMDANFQNGSYDLIMASDFSSQLNLIPCNRRSIWMQQCNSGGFIEYLQNNKSTVLTACHASESAYPSDNLDIYGNYMKEWETINYGGVEHTYRHGEFNLHAMASIVGEYPTGDMAFSDFNNDNEISAFETKDYNEQNNSRYLFSGVETPQWSDLGELGEYTSLKYPTLLFTDIAEDKYYRGIIGISKDVHVNSGNQLNFIANADVYLLNEAKLIVDEGASLILEDNVSFSGNSANQIRVDGDIQVGDYVSFSRNGSTGYFDGLHLNNHSLQTSLNYAVFTKSRLHNYGNSLNIRHSTFDDCYIIYSHRGNVTVTNETNFDRTWLYLENTEDNNKTASVTDCIFSTDYTMAAIDIWNYNQYNISNNTIDGYYNGIQILQSGYGDTKKNRISDNTITNCTQRGILAYGTRGAVYRNHISNNRYGVWFGDHSSMRLYGYSGAETNDETQEIFDNYSYEIYASQYSFPIYFRYNVIIDDDNGGAPGDPLVYHSEGLGGTPIKGVRYNCWEDEPGAFVAAEDLYPVGYIWEPTWCPETGGGITTGPDEDMYEVANSLFDAEDYTGAQSMYEMLIDQYPQSKFAKAAMQELFALEKFVSNDYSDLKQYYENNTDPELSETGDYLVSKCDIKLENWPDAISYYENIILDPETMEDSIFAIIDLGYVYFMMENSSYKSAHTGNLAQYKPASKEQFFENRNYLLSLIPSDPMNETMKGNIAELQGGKLLQNVPNPFKGSTQIWYKLESESIVKLNVYNYTGQLISTINEGSKTKGNHFIDFDASGLKNGIYLYSININGQTTDTKKMTIMK